MPGIEGFHFFSSVYLFYLCFVFFQVRSWMEESIPGVNHCVLAYVIGLDSLKATSHDVEPSWQSCGDIRLRMDGLFKLKEHAVQLTKEFTALYTNGPAGGGGIR